MTRKGSNANHVNVYQVRVDLVGFRPPIWRRLEVPGTFTLNDLHEALQVVFGWDGSHLHEFRIADRRYTQEGPDDFASIDPFERSTLEVTLDEVMPAVGKSFIYTYDFGDNWRHKIKVEAVTQWPSAFVRLTAGRNAAPQEDSAGRSFDPPFDLQATASYLATRFDSPPGPEPPHPRSTTRHAAEPKVSKQAKRAKRQPSPLLPSPAPAPPADSKAEVVEGLLVKSLVRHDLAEADRERAVELWRQYVCVAQPAIRKAVTYAAAIEYYAAQARGEKLTQVEAARRYKANSDSVGRYFKRMCEVLGDPSPAQPEKASLFLVTEDTSTNGEPTRKGLFDALDSDADADIDVAPRFSPAQRAMLRSLPRKPDGILLAGMRQLHNPERFLEPTAIPSDGVIHSVFWFEPQAESVRAHDLIEGCEKRAAFDLLPVAAGDPVAGERMLPGRVITESPTLATWLRAELKPLGVDLILEQGPNEDIDRIANLLHDVLESMPDIGDMPGDYLEAGEIPAGVLRLFDAASELAKAAPWRYLDDDQVLEVTWTERGKRKRKRTFCVSVLGAAGEVYGIAVFKNRAEFERFVSYSATSESLDTDAAALNLVPLDYLSPLQQQQVATHNWPVAGPEHYPLVIPIAPKSVGKPGPELHRTLARCASAVARFTEFNATSLKRGGSAYLEVRIDYPTGDLESLEASYPYLGS